MDIQNAVSDIARAIKGSIYCRPHLRGLGLIGKTSDKLCGVCGLRRRGKGHNDGSHHKLAMAKKA